MRPSELIPIPTDMKEVNFPNESVRNAYVAVFASIQKAMELTESGVRFNNQPMIIGLDSWHEFLNHTGGHETVWSDQAGFISEADIFTTTRDGWCKFSTYPYGRETQAGLPQVRGVRRGDTRHISIERSGNSGVFDNAALPSGASKVRLYESGEIKIVDNPGSDERPATDDELKEVFDVFSAIYEKLNSLEIEHPATD